MLSNLNSNGIIFITNIPDINKKKLYLKKLLIRLVLLSTIKDIITILLVL